MGQDKTGRKRYHDFNSYLRGIFGCRVQKVAIDAGFTCPNRDGTHSWDGCVYCDAKGSGTGAWAQGRGIAEQIRTAVNGLRRRYHACRFLAYFQSFSNTYASAARLRAAYDEALSIPEVVGLCIGTRPDCIDDEVLDLISSYKDRGMIWLEYGLQSAHDATLARINRGHDVRCFFRAVEKTAQHGIPVCAHLILGLPGEDRQAIRETARRISSLPLKGVKLHSQYIVRATTLARWYEQGDYRPWTREQYVETVCDVLERIPEDWVIQRLTGDPPARGFVAPSWALEKQKTLRLIDRRLEQRGTRQGRLA
jgi:radical SAM protein (TIGR01212 family)